MSMVKMVVSASFGASHLVVVFSFLVLLVPSISAYAGDRVALVLGNAEYQGNARLSNPVNDARAIAGVFSDMNFDEVVVVNDATRLGMEQALDQFHDLASNAETAVFFFAGHAIQWQGGNYLVPVDVVLESERDIKKLILLDDVVSDASAASKLGLVILDACRNNPFLAQLEEQGTRGFQRAGLASPAGAAGTLVAFATQADAVALDGKGTHSPYTEALINHLPTANKDISLVFRAVRDEVAAATDWKQQPFTYGSLGGDEIWLVADESIAPSTGAGSVAKIKREPPKPPQGMSFFTVESDPPDARVRILKPEMAYAPGMLLPIGRQYQIMVSRKGYRATRQTVSISKPSTTIEVSLDLRNAAAANKPVTLPSQISKKVAVSVQQSSDSGSQVAAESQTSTLIDYLRSENIDAVSGDTFNADIILNIALYYNVTFDRTYSAYNADCSLKMDVRHSRDNRLISSKQLGVDPAGGFSKREVRGDCQRRLMSRLRKPAIESILSASSETEVSASQLSVAIKNIDGREITSLMDSLNQAPSVTGAFVNNFSDGVLVIKVSYQGEAIEFVDVMQQVALGQSIELNLDEMSATNLVLAVR